jgi:hypothetical protein
VAPGTAGARHMAGEGSGVRREAEQSKAEQSWRLKTGTDS